MFEVKKRVFKESIVDSFYTFSCEDPIIVTTLAGPNFDRIAELAYSKLEPIEINSYEIDEQTYLKQMIQLEYEVSPDIKSISNVFFQDVNKCIVSNFMDIDLMGTLLTQGNTIRNLLEQQSYLIGTKVFISTLSLRAKDVGLQNTLEFISNLLSLVLADNIEIGQVKESDCVSGVSYRKDYSVSLLSSKRIKELQVIHYADRSGPMCTFRVIYK